MGYLTATNAAYAAMTDQVFSFWNQVFETLSPEPEKPQSRSWYVEPKPFRSVAVEAPGAWPFMLPWMWMDADAAGTDKPLRAADHDPFSMPAWMRAPLESWLNLMKPQTMMACPMAYGMISAGVPHTVAWPAAQANVAVMEACNIAARTLQTALDNYQSACSKTASGIR